jgi:hypothetical protein
MFETLFPDAAFWFSVPAVLGWGWGRIGCLPVMHDLADQACIELPQALGQVKQADLLAAPRPIAEG